MLQLALAAKDDELIKKDERINALTLSINELE
jgi:hypothetical protein